MKIGPDTKAEKSFKVEYIFSLFLFILVALLLLQDFHQGVEQEQTREVAKLNIIVESIENQFSDIEQEIEQIRKILPGKPSQERKKELLVKLRAMEEEGYRLQLAYQDFRNDNSIQYDPFKSAFANEQFIKSIGLKVAVDRYVRSMESMMFINRPSTEGKILMEEQYWALKWHLDNY